MTLVHEDVFSWLKYIQTQTFCYCFNYLQIILTPSILIFNAYILIYRSVN